MCQQQTTSIDAIDAMFDNVNHIVDRFSALFGGPQPPPRPVPPTRPGAAQPLTQSQLRAVVNQITYKPGWSFRVTRRDNCVTLVCIFPADERDTGLPTHFEMKQHFPASAFVEPGAFLQACMQIVLDCEVHEAQEMFRYKGILLFDPHKGEKKGGPK